jgi:hypothetical protein
MKNSKEIIKGTIGAVILILIFLSFRSAPVPTERNSRQFEGLVTTIFEGPSFDILFSVSDYAGRFYINRGLEKGLTINQLSADLLGKEVIFTYPRHWTPLDPFHSIRHVSKLVCQDKIIYSEME